MPSGNDKQTSKEEVSALYAKARASLTPEELKQLAVPDLSQDVPLDELILELEEMLRKAEQKRACG